MNKSVKPSKSDFYQNVTDIDFALVEDVRPPMYKGLKYWGKKPHNIWSKYIENYVAEGDIVLDLFAGSGVCALEAIQIGRRAISVDLNPLSKFVVEFLISDFDENLFSSAATSIIDKTNQYLKEIDQFETTCIKCLTKCSVINYKWDSNKVYEVGYNCLICDDNLLKEPDDDDHAKSAKMENIEIYNWYPDYDLPDGSAFNRSFRKATNNKYKNIWTNRNLAIEAFIFNLIEKTESKELKKALLFAFISSLHLNTKMCVPRRSDANRPFSTSWGRSAFIMAARQMEMNPVVTFARSCFEKQGVISVKASTLPKFKNKVKQASSVQDFFSNKEKNLLLLTADSTLIDTILPKNSVDFILTDPPYGGLVQYLSLSSLWTIWLSRIYPDFEQNYESEITINSENDFESYHRMLLKAFTGANKVLKGGQKMVVTFHNDQINIWNSLLRATDNSGFKMQKIIYQPNRRTGESNVANPYGTSASDFYLRFVRKETIDFEASLRSTRNPNYKDVVINAAKDVIIARGEPTDEAFLLNGIYVELAKHGQFLEGTLEEIKNILNSQIGITFITFPETDSRLGGRWWVSDSVRNFPNLPLSERLETAIIQNLKRNISSTYDEVLSDIFQAFPNGLTPNTKDVRDILAEYGIQDKRTKKWKLKPSYEVNETQHSIYIGKIAELALKSKFEVWIGTREQSDIYNGRELRELVNAEAFLSGLDPKSRDRIKMIDLILVKNNEIASIIEVENSTSITSALERGSHIQDNVARLIVIPDERRNFLDRKMDEPLFRDYFMRGNWKTSTYSEVDSIIGQVKLRKKSTEQAVKELFHD